MVWQWSVCTSLRVCLPVVLAATLVFCLVTPLLFSLLTQALHSVYNNVACVFQVAVGTCKWSSAA